MGGRGEDWPRNTGGGYMNKYILFAGHNYYPEGGFDDFHGSFETIEAAKEWLGLNPNKISNQYIDHWCHIVDRNTWEIVGRFKQSSINGNLRIAGLVEVDNGF